MLSDAQQVKYDALCQQALDAFTAAGDNKRRAAKALNWSYINLSQRYDAAVRKRMKPSKAAVAAARKAAEAKPVKGGRVGLFDVKSEALPARGKVKRFLLTSAQNNTDVNEIVWDGLQAYADHVGARVLVSRCTYNKAAYDNPEMAKPGSGNASDYDDLWYDPRIAKHTSDVRIRLAPGLMWCGEANIIPTAARPLSGFESYTGRHSGIFPHSKMAMQSIATMKGAATKFNYTTGAVTQRNYIQRKAGLKAEFHHSYGALLVEVDDGGNWWCRQINADKSGTFYDLDVKVEAGKVTTGHRLEAITWGDVHVAQVDDDVRALAWGKGGMLDALKPRHQFFHDVLDMRARNHHDRKDPLKQFAKHVRGQASVGTELQDVVAFLRAAGRKDCRSVVVDSNHHDHMLRWVKENDWREDPENAEFYIDAVQVLLRAIRTGDDAFNLLEWAVNREGGAPVTFLGQDESFVICANHGDGIECGLHGDRGPNGARPSPYSLANMGRKASVGHSHSAGIYDGVYVAGTSSKFDLGYNVGPSSWSHSHIVTYANGKRAIVTMWNGKWRA